MVSYGKVVGGQFVNATIDINRKGELALSPVDRSLRSVLSLKRDVGPTLTADAVAAWEEILSETHGGAADAVSKVGQAVSLAAFRGRVGRAASAAVGSVVDLVAAAPHTVRVDWVDGKQSLIQLPDELFQHLAILLKDCQIATAAPPPAAPIPPPPPGVIGQLTELAGAVRSALPGVTGQIAKLAALRDQGALTEDEFAAQKAELLGRSAPDAESATAAAPQFEPPPPASPPAWVPDPHRRYELRYWDGTVWTEHVSSGGVQSTDPA